MIAGCERFLETYFVNLITSKVLLFLTAIHVALSPVIAISVMANCPMGRKRHKNSTRFKSLGQFIVLSPCRPASVAMDSGKKWWFLHSSRNRTLLVSLIRSLFCVYGERLIACSLTNKREHWYTPSVMGGWHLDGDHSTSTPQS